METLEPILEVPALELAAEEAAFEIAEVFEPVEKALLSGVDDAREKLLTPESAADEAPLSLLVPAAEGEYELMFEEITEPATLDPAVLPWAEI